MTARNYGKEKQHPHTNNNIQTASPERFHSITPFVFNIYSYPYVIHS